MNNRFKELRKELHMSQEEFGRLLGLSKSGVSDIESGRRNVTEQHLIMLKNSKDLEKPVSEEWLRTGEGEMFLPMDRETELAKLTVGLLNEESDSFKSRFVSMLARMNDAEWELLEKMVNELSKKE